MSHRSLARVSQQILNRPLLVTPRHATFILSVLRSDLNISLIEQVDGVQLDRAAMANAQKLARAEAEAAIDARDQRVAAKLFDEQNGIAIIPIYGTLMKNWGLDPFSGSTGYDGIKMKIAAAMEDDAISAIYLDIDSPGGMVAGCFDLADFIFACNARNGGKPIIAIANEQACSAAYCIGACADELWVPRTGEVGSVGVLWIYTNIEGALDQAGVKVTVFRAGADKARGNPYEAMDAGTAQRIQGELDAMRGIFAETVARGRGLAVKTVLDTEARTYMGVDARDIQFATGVASDDQVWTSVLERYGR